MERAGRRGWLVVLMFCPAALSQSAEKVSLVERVESGVATRVVWVLSAEGTIRPAEPEDGAKPEAAALKVRSRVAYVDVRLAGPAEGVGRSSRTIETAEATIEGSGPIRSSNQAMRRGRAALVAERREGRTVVACPSGPLTRDELELAQGPLDPLELAELLPAEPVAAGDRWPLADAAVRILTGYDRIDKHDLEGGVQASDADEVRLDLRGEATGQALGAGGRMKLAGTIVFDRKLGRVVEVDLRRSEVRAAGPVEAGLEMQSTLKLSRTPAESKGDAAAEFPPTLPGAWLDLAYQSPGGRYSLTHDRSWYVVAEDDKQVALRRLRDGGVLSQCNLAVAPTLDASTKADLPAFKDEVKKALGDRFERFLDVGEVGGVEPGGTRFRVAALGKQDDQAIRWTYYRLLGPRGEQVVAAFTMREDRTDAFGEADLRLIDGFAWGAGAAR